MKHELIIVRYGEIGLKAKETRRRFENTLINNIKSALKTKQINNKIKNEKGRIFIYTSKINVSILILQKIFGIISISPAIHTSSDIETMSKILVKISKGKINQEKSFALRVTRIGKHNYSSQDVAIKIGNDIVNETKAKVNLTMPDFELFIDIRETHSYIFTEKIRGPGGLPLGTQGNALAIITDIKSILAAWYLMRRGCKIHIVNINKENSNILRSFLKNWYIVTDVLTHDIKKNNLNEKLNKIIAERNCDAIIIGDTNIKNSQNELSTIKILKKTFNLPIFNPLIAMDDNEISQKCKEIEI